MSPTTVPFDGFAHGTATRTSGSHAAHCALLTFRCSSSGFHRWSRSTTIGAGSVRRSRADVETGRDWPVLYSIVRVAGLVGADSCCARSPTRFGCRRGRWSFPTSRADEPRHPVGCVPVSGASLEHRDTSPLSMGGVGGPAFGGISGTPPRRLR
jgi:hypothetical protein